LRCEFYDKSFSTVFPENSACAVVVAMHSLLPRWAKSCRPLRVGEIATVGIERTDDYDLHSTAVGV